MDLNQEKEKRKNYVADSEDAKLDTGFGTQSNKYFRCDSQLANTRNLQQT